MGRQGPPRLGQVRRGRGAGLLQARARCRHHLLRHRRQLQCRPLRGDHGRHAHEDGQARGDRAVDQGRHPPEPGRQRRRHRPQASDGLDRPAAQAPADRLHRRLPGPPARSAHADGRDHVLARPARALGQGALHRRLDHAGLQVRPDGDDRRLEGLCPADCHAEPLQHDPARGGARDEPAVPRAGRRSHSLFAAGARLFGGQPQQGRRRRHRTLEERRAGPGRHLSRLRLGDRRTAEEGRGRQECLARADRARLAAQQALHGLAHHRRHQPRPADVGCPGDGVRHHRRTKRRCSRSPISSAFRRPTDAAARPGRRST